MKKFGAEEFLAKYGRNVEGSLNLRGTGITALPDNLTVGGYLDLRGTGITALPDNLTVGGYLDLRDTGITALPDNLTVGGSLDLRDTGITALPDNLTVGGSLNLRGTGITSLPDNLTVGGSLNLRGTGITSLPDNLTVGGYLDLEGCTGITALPDNLTVGGSLDLRDTGITALPDNLTVGGYLDLRDTGITDEMAARVNRALPVDFYPLRWRGGQYISVDGIFSEVVSQKGNVWKIRTIGKRHVTYLVTDGQGRWSHGDTLQAARDDLIYKIGNRDTSRYADMTLESVLPFAEAIEAYRVITGACAAGTRHFVQSLASVKDAYSIREICELTKGQYGAERFRAFFANKMEA